MSHRPKSVDSGSSVGRNGNLAGSNMISNVKSSSFVAPTYHSILGESSIMHSASRRSDYFVQPEVFDPYLAQKLFVGQTPLDKFYTDISKMKPVKYEAPNPEIVNRKFKIVQEKVTLGQPMTPEEFKKMLKHRPVSKSVITYGHDSAKTVGSQSNITVKSQSVGNLDLKSRVSASLTRPLQSRKKTFISLSQIQVQEPTKIKTNPSIGKIQIGGTSQKPKFKRNIGQIQIGGPAAPPKRRPNIGRISIGGPEKPVIRPGISRVSIGRSGSERKSLTIKRQTKQKEQNRRFSSQQKKNKNSLENVSLVKSRWLS